MFSSSLVNEIICNLYKKDDLSQGIWSKTVDKLVWSFFWRGEWMPWVICFICDQIIPTVCLCVVYWPSTWPNMPFQRRGSCIFHWRTRAWLTIWDKVKSRGTVIDWCTGREWPVNCMTVISARWQSNMPFQRQWKWHISDGQLWGDIEWTIELLYNSVKTGSQFWRPDPLVTRCGRESSTQRSGPAGLRLSSPGERERHNADGHKSRGQYIAVLFSLQLPLTHKPYK